jgi:membrane fusion protein (multidrug efflux system)
MNWKRIIGIVAGIALIAIVVIRLKSNKEQTQERVYIADKNEKIPVKVKTIALESIGGNYDFSGTFEPDKETKISSETQGKINQVMVEVGDMVRKGQTLIQLDNSLLKLQLQSVEVQIDGLETDVKRFSILAKADAVQGIQLEKAELGLRSARIQKATVQEQINKTIIKAPFDGIVTAKLSEEGAFAAPGIPLLQITAISKLRFTVNIPENDLISFKKNAIYTVTADAYPSLNLKGKLSLIGSKANMGSSFPIQFDIQNTADLKIKAGMFGKVHIGEATNENGFVIPSAALVGSSSEPKVYLVKNGKAYLSNVTISKRFQNKILIAKGLNEGDVVVIGGLINLFDKANVRITKNESK